MALTGRDPHKRHSQQAGGDNFDITLKPEDFKVDIETNLSRINIVGDLTINDESIGTSIDFDKVVFNTAATPTLSEGELAYNAHNLTVDIKSKNATLSINQEGNLPVKNITGSTLFNGKLVRITGYDAVGKYWTVDYSDNSKTYGGLPSNAFVDGMLTQDIEDGDFGLMVYKGEIHDLNTFLGTSASDIYLGKNGDFTEIEPSFPDTVVVVGKFGDIDPVIGSIFIDTSSQFQKTIFDIHSELDLKQTTFPGVCLQCPITENDITIDTTNFILEIATVKNGQTITSANPIRVFTDGDGYITKHEYISVLTFVFTNTTGVWYFYVDSNGSAIATQTPWTGDDFKRIAAIYRFYWNATLTGAERLVVESLETHTNDISASDHAWKHAMGSIWETGLDIYHNQLTTGTPNADGRNTCISLSTGRCSDDGLEWAVTNTYPNAAVNYFEQNMGVTVNASITTTTSGLFPIRINDSAGRLITSLPATRFPFAWNTANNRPQYITTTGVRTDVPDDNFFVYYLYNFSDRTPGRTIKLVSASTPFTSLTNAQAHNWDVLRSEYATLNDQEIRPLYKLIFQVNHTNPSPYDAAVKYTVLRERIDIRKTTPSATQLAGASIAAANVTTVSKTILSSTNAESELQQVNDIFDISRIDNSITRMDTTTGKIFQNSPIYISDDANIGVNVPTPTLTFQATKSVGSTNVVYLDNANTNILMGISATDALSIGTNANATLNITTNATNRISILGNGNVGIGTASASSKLHVQDGNIAVFATGGAGTKGYLFETGDYGFLDYNRNLSGLRLSALNYDATSVIQIGGNSNAEYGSSTFTSRMVVNVNSGNVGIGTSHLPATKLEIATNGNNALRLSTAGSQGSYSYGEIQMQTANGTVASPTIIEANGYIGSWVSRGWDGQSYKDGGFIAMKVNGTPSVNNLPVDIIFGTNRGAASATETARFTFRGNLTLNGATETTNILIREAVVKSPTNGVGQFRVVTNTGVIGKVNVVEFSNVNTMYVGTETSHPLSFVTGNVERMSITNDGKIIYPLGTAPASATAAGTTGTVIYTTDYVYVCTATNTWKRTALTTW